MLTMTGSKAVQIFAASITPVFPTSLNNFSEGDVIEEEDWNAIELTIGETSTTSKSTLHGKWNDLFGSTTMPQLTTLSNLVTVGTLNSGAISSGFGNIDIGSSNLDADGTVTFAGLSDGCLEASSGVLSSTGSSCAASGGVFSWTANSWGNSTSTTIGFTNGIIVTGSSTAQELKVTNATSTNATTTNALALTYNTPARLITVNSAGTATSTDLNSWVAGTSNVLTVTDDSDGTITLDLPDHVIFPSTFQVTSASSTNATTTNIDITGLLTFNSVTGDEWTDFCTTITGGAGLCDGTDATAGSGLGTSTDIADTYVIYGTAADTVGAEAAFTYDDATDRLTVVNASTTRVSVFTEFLAGGTASTSIDSAGNLVTNNATATNATTTTLSVSGQVDFDTYTSAILLTGAGGILAEYAGDSCTNQFPRSTDALGAWTCASVNVANDVTGTLTVGNGGTGAATFGQGWLHTVGGTNAFTASTSPTVNYLTATSTSATSTFAAGLQTTALNVTGSATSTFGNGLVFTAGTLKLQNDLCSGLGNGGALTTDTDGTIICEADDSGAGGGDFAWTSTTYGGVVVNATTTGLWLQATSPHSLIASSTLFTSGTATDLFVVGEGNTSTSTLQLNGAADAWLMGVAEDVDKNFRIASSSASLEENTVLTVDKSSLLTTVHNALTVTGNLTASANIIFAGDTIDELVGDGLEVSSGDLIFDCSDVVSTGLQCSGEDLQLNATGDWTGTLDNLEAAAFLRSDANDTGTGLLTLSGGILVTSTSTFTATTTFDGNIGQPFASSTGATSHTVDWANGTTQRYILTAATDFIINSTSSNPTDGGRYMLKICQDGTGSRAVTFATPGALRWGGITPATTTIDTTADECTFIGMVYDSTYSIYNVVGSSTNNKIR